jgi:two-component system chemotaxis response regulator CheY
VSATILTVDDSATVRQLVRSALEAEGHEVREAGDGVEALQMLRTTRVDCVITDLYMPIMDGLTLVRAIRGLQTHRFTPILLLTTEAGEETKRAGREAGATGWLVKPFRREQLRQVVLRVLGSVRAEA